MWSVGRIAQLRRPLHSRFRARAGRQCGRAPSWSVRGPPLLRRGLPHPPGLPRLRVLSLGIPRPAGELCARTMSRAQRSYCATRYTAYNIRVLLRNSEKRLQRRVNSCSFKGKPRNAPPRSEFVHSLACTVICVTYTVTVHDWKPKNHRLMMAPARGGGGRFRVAKSEIIRVVARKGLIIEVARNSTGATDTPYPSSSTAQD
eukprot:COSAG05_NODE_860_length_6900_cov_15.221291_5_plen_202_part_00